MRARKPVRRVSRQRDFAATKHEVPVVAKRLSKAYHHEPTPRWRKWWYLSVTVFICGLVAGIIYSPIFTIQNVIVNNVNFKPTEVKLAELIKQITEQSRWLVMPQKNLIFFNRGLAAEALGKELYLDEVTIDKHWPNVLKVNVASNLVVGIWQAENGEFLLDRRGYIVQRLLEVENSNVLPLIEEQQGPLRSLGDQVIDGDMAVFIDQLYVSWRQQLPDRMPGYIQVNATALPTIRVYMPDGWYVNMTGESDAGDQIQRLKRLLEERIKEDSNKLEYIDVRFGNRLYFKLK